MTPFERVARQPLMLGLFLPHQQGAWSPSRAPRATSWTFDYNAACATKAVIELDGCMTCLNCGDSKCG